MEEQVILDYTQNYLTFKELQKKHRISQETIYKILNKNNIKRFPREESIYLRNAKENGCPLSQKELEQAIIDNYLSGQGQKASGRPFGLTYSNVKTILKKYNIPIRNQQESASISSINRRIYNCNDNYFDIESHNMAYILGFLASDGSVNEKDNRIKIGLSSIDREILEKIKREIQIEKEILDYITNHGFNVSELVWTSREHKRKLREYGIVPNKTFKLQPPYSLTPKYYIDYIRGYFDGDGSVNLIKNTNGRGQGNIRWQICSATPEILKWILNVLETFGIKRTNLLKQSRKGQLPIYYFQFSSVPSREIFKILYTPNSLKLKRKYDHFEKIVKLFE